MCRLLMNFVLARGGLPFTVLSTRGPLNRGRYVRAIKESYRVGSCVPMARRVLYAVEDARRAFEGFRAQRARGFRSRMVGGFGDLANIAGQEGGNKSTGKEGQRKSSNRGLAKASERSGCVPGRRGVVLEGMPETSLDGKWSPSKGPAPSSPKSPKAASWVQSTLRPKGYCEEPRRAVIVSDSRLREDQTARCDCGACPRTAFVSDTPGVKQTTADVRGSGHPQRESESASSCGCLPPKPTGVNFPNLWDQRLDQRFKEGGAKENGRQVYGDYAGRKRGRSPSKSSSSSSGGAAAPADTGSDETGTSGSEEENSTGRGGHDGGDSGDAGEAETEVPGISLMQDFERV
jgi:hypothetical protein